jgi:hypothetical protein
MGTSRPIRSTSTGYSYNHDFNRPLQPSNSRKRAVAELGSLWGAVDILEDKTGVPYEPWEVNSAPGMGDPIANSYATQSSVTPKRPAAPLERGTSGASSA